MSYKTFDSYSKGYSHIKNGTDCEDFAASYADPEGRYYISVICDGHSDNNCFRSSKGARFGCESAVETLTRFFDLYYEDNATIDLITPEAELRLKRSLKQCWDDKVLADIRSNPITEAEKEPLSERVRSIYEAGRGLLNIYGATLLAVAVCGDAFIALHIGDGVMLCVDQDGTYYEPLPDDEKSETGSPASLCDSDLFSRNNAFRSLVSPTIPIAVVVSSDGIGDCLDQLDFMEFTYNLISKLKTMESETVVTSKLNNNQKGYLDSCTAYYSAKGNGVEDDCSISGIYSNEDNVPEVKVPLSDAEKMWSAMTAERTGFIEDYEKRKSDVISNINAELNDSLRLGLNIIDSLRLGLNIIESRKLPMLDSWIEKKKKVGELKKVLYNIDHNENNKILYYDQKLEQYAKYIRRANGVVCVDIRQSNITEIPEKYFKEDEKLNEVIAILGECRDKRDNRDRIKKQDTIFEDNGEGGRGFFDSFGLKKGLNPKRAMDSNDDQEILETESQELAEAEAAFKNARKDLARIFKDALAADLEFIRS